MAVLTFDEIMEQCLSHVSDDVDKREGSIIYDAIAPCARELANMYESQAQDMDNTFAGTANREWLIKRCAEIGIAPNEASYAVRKGIFTPSTLEIAIGERFSYEDLNFVVIEKTEEAGVYHLQCETAGEVGNHGAGQLVPIQYVQGLATATLSGDVVIYGEDEEDTEALRQRYFDTLPTMTLDGNVAQYSKWCREYEGIGNFKIFPEWNGKNTVKVSILSSDNTIASNTLITNFQNYLDPNDEPINDSKGAENYPQGRGVGMGKAPIGAIVTVNTATETPINVSAMLTLKEGYEQPVNLATEINDYLKTLNYVRTTVSYVAIAAIVQNNSTVDSVLDVTINGAKTNVELGDEQIVKLGETNFEVL